MTRWASKEECDCLQYTQKLTSYYEQYIDTSLCCHINDYIYIQLTYTSTLSIAHAFIYDHIYIRTYILGSPSHLSHSGWGMCEGHYPFCTCIALLHLCYPFALALPIICTCITHLHLYYTFALVLPVCTCITHLYLHYPLFALALPIICTCITHYLHLYYPFALELPICTCITHYPSIVGVNNAHNCIINCKASSALF